MLSLLIFGLPKSIEILRLFIEFAALSQFFSIVSALDYRSIVHHLDFVSIFGTQELKCICIPLTLVSVVLFTVLFNSFAKKTRGRH